MSRWIRSVNALLENIDGTVEQAVENRELDREADELYLGDDAMEGVDAGGVGSDGMEDILAKRGLADSDDDDEGGDEALEPGNHDQVEEEEEEEEVTLLQTTGTVGEMGMKGEKPLFESSTHGSEALVDAEKVATTESKVLPESRDSAALSPTELSASKSNDSNDSDIVEALSDEDGNNAIGAAESTGENAEFKPDAVADAGSKQKELDEGGEEEGDEDALKPSSPTSSAQQQTGKQTEKLSLPTSGKGVSAPTVQTAGVTSAAASANAAKQAKEIRKLRRHVVKLNDDLEATEREMDAQRVELERAAARMERDRTRHKQERETDKAEHAKELDVLRADYEARIEEMAAAHTAQMEDMRKRIERAEEMRAREGGEWNTELEEAVKRERHAEERVVLLEDEKTTLTGHVSTLQTQIQALETRLESSTRSAETASEREREAEDRLDSALSLHARQLGQRQAREAELERTVAELGAALVVARQKEQNRLNSKPDQEGLLSDKNGDAVGNGERHASLRSQLSTAEDELETLRAQLSLEQQRCQTLHQELRDMSKEHTEEASAVHARERQYDRQIADLTATVSRLQSTLKKMEESNVSQSNGMSSGDGSLDARDENAAGLFREKEMEMKQQIASLSDEILRQRSKIDNSKGEVSTLKSRLRAAITRAEVAEKALTMSGNVTDTSFDIERAAGGGGDHYDGGKIKRRVKGGRKSHASRETSIRSALGLQPGRVDGEGKEQLGRTIDAIDTMSLHTGAFFRYNPIARLGFILYILLLHIWAFCLIIFHAHSFEAEPLDSHGPHALFMHYPGSYRHMEQLPKNSLIAPNAPNP